MTLSVKAFAKINLFLDIEARRDDGYHDILSVMQSIDLCDDITLEKIERGIELSNDIGIEKERDLAYRAAAAFFGAVGARGGVRISVDKRIPMGAGLAGGSADAAAVLRGLNSLYGDPLSKKELAELGLTLGSDVPFCVIGGTKITRGRGEKMTDMPAMPDCPMVVAIGDDHVSTPAQFAELDRRFDNFVSYRPKSECVDGLFEAFSNESAAIEKYLYNIFEITGRFSPEIKEIMTSCGARGTLMSGSGSSVFGIFRNDADAAEAADKLTESGYRAFMCRPINNI